MSKEGDRWRLFFDNEDAYPDTCRKCKGVAGDDAVVFGDGSVECCDCADGGKAKCDECDTWTDQITCAWLGDDEWYLCDECLGERDLVWCSDCNELYLNSGFQCSMCDEDVCPQCVSDHDC